jgi:putative spermidine/putrescine transport system permease protein
MITPARTRARRRHLAIKAVEVGFCGGVIVWLAAPILVVIPMSFTAATSFKFPPDQLSTRWYENLSSNPAWYQAAINSLQIAFVVTILATVLGVAAALALVRSSLRGKIAINGFLLAPMIVPLVITGVGVYATFLQWKLTGTFLGFVLAHTALAVPFVVVTATASLQSYDRHLEKASLSLGAGALATFRLVTLPLIAPGVLAGALFAFMTSFDEVVVATFLVDPDIQTLPVKMFTSVFRENDPTVAAASSLIVVLTTTSLILVALLMWRRGSLNVYR